MTATAPAPSSRRSRVRFARAAGLAIAAAATTVVGVFIAGGVITDDFRLSMALTALWYIGAGAIAIASFKAGPFHRHPDPRRLPDRRRRHGRLPRRHDPCGQDGP